MLRGLKYPENSELDFENNITGNNALLNIDVFVSTGLVGDTVFVHTRRSFIPFSITPTPFFHLILVVFPVALMTHTWLQPVILFSKLN